MEAADSSNDGNFFFPMARQPLGGLGRLIFRGFTITHFVDTPHSVGLLRHRDLYLTTHNTQQETDIHALGGIRTHNPSKRAAVDPRLRPRGHWNRPQMSAYVYQTIRRHMPKDSKRHIHYLENLAYQFCGSVHKTINLNFEKKTQCCVLVDQVSVASQNILGSAYSEVQVAASCNNSFQSSLFRA
jgi:hypothetical protein